MDISCNFVQSQEKSGYLMLTRERKAHLLEILERDRRLVAKSLSAQLGLSEDTIRRDLRELAAEGLLQRVHGGALPASLAEADFAGRMKIAPADKAAIGRKAAGLIRSGQIVFIDGGTTAIQLARHLPQDLRATVVTHSPNIAIELAEHPMIDVEIIGGRLFKHSVVAVGAVAVENIARIRADIYMMGVTGVHTDAGLTTGDLEEASIKRQLVRQSVETIVLASSEKLTAVSPFTIAALSDVTAIVVEVKTPQALVSKFQEAGLTVHLA